MRERTGNTNAVCSQESTTSDAPPVTKVNITYFGEKEEELFAISDSDTARKERLEKVKAEPLSPDLWWALLGSEPQCDSVGSDGWKIRAFKRADSILRKSKDGFTDSTSYFSICITLAELQAKSEPGAARLLLRHMQRHKIGTKEVKFYTVYAQLERDQGTLLRCGSVVLFAIM